MSPAKPGAGGAGAETRGYSRNKEAVRKRLRRIEGQVRGVERMVEEERYCIDVVTQVTAIQAALDKVALELLADHAAHCVVDAPAGMKDERTEELMGAVRRLLRRG
jgi:DNA-binding FrmR family transcriptional regulator